MTSIRKKNRWKAIIAAIAFALAAVAIFVFAPKSDSKPTDTVVPKKDSISESTSSKEKPAISEDSIRRKMERWREREREGYKKEMERFEKVLQQASDKELLVVLKYAIAHHYVPSRDIDPYHNVYAGVGCWHRTKMVYEKLRQKPDLLRKIYPDSHVLGEYVNSNAYARSFTDTIAAQTILSNAQKEGKYFVDLLMGKPSDKSSLVYKYFGTPLMRP